jgi:hypothetical protein
MGCRSAFGAVAAIFWLMVTRPVMDRPGPGEITYDFF